MHTHMSTSLVNHYQANLQGYRTCTGVAKRELSVSPSINTFVIIYILIIYIYQHIHTPHDPSPLLHTPTHLSLLHTHTHTRTTHTHITTHLLSHTCIPPTPTLPHTHITTYLHTHTCIPPIHPHNAHTHTNFLRRRSLFLLSSSGLTFLQ